jgi:hypothetical protein
MVELGSALSKLCPFIPELKLWVFWTPIFINQDIFIKLNLYE